MFMPVNSKNWNWGNGGTTEQTRKAKERVSERKTE